MIGQPPPIPTDDSLPLKSNPAGRPNHARKPSLQRAQDSRENLKRQRSNKATRSETQSRREPSASRAREFRVGNIGNNGLIYLRFVFSP